MSQRIVDIFELVEIEHQHRKGIALSPHLRSRLLEFFRQQGPIGKAGQMVVVSHERNAFVGSAAFRDIRMGANPTAVG